MPAESVSMELKISLNTVSASSTACLPSATLVVLVSPACTAFFMPVSISRTRSAIWRLELSDSSASLRTSSATTAKPRPASPARAASMAALSAKRFVCPAMFEIISTMREISCEFLASASIDACTTAVPRSISVMCPTIFCTEECPRSTQSTVVCVVPAISSARCAACAVPPAIFFAVSSARAVSSVCCAAPLAISVTEVATEFAASADRCAASVRSSEERARLLAFSWIFVSRTRIVCFIWLNPCASCPISSPDSTGMSAPERLPPLMVRHASLRYTSGAAVRRAKSTMAAPASSMAAIMIAARLASRESACALISSTGAQTTATQVRFCICIGRNCARMSLPAVLRYCTVCSSPLVTVSLNPCTRFASRILPSPWSSLERSSFPTSSGRSWRTTTMPVSSAT